MVCHLYYHQLGFANLTSFANFISVASNLKISLRIKLRYFFDTFQDVSLILLGPERMCGWYKRLNSG